jgi:hypothetical protein
VAPPPRTASGTRRRRPAAGPAVGCAHVNDARGGRRRARRAQQLVLALAAQLGERLHSAVWSLREDTRRAHKLAADRIQPVLGDGARDIVGDLEGVLDAQAVAVARHLVEATDIDLGIVSKKQEILKLRPPQQL